MFQLWLKQGKLICMLNFVLDQTSTPTSATSVIPKSLYTSEAGNIHDYERKVAWSLSMRPNIKL